MFFMHSAVYEVHEESHYKVESILEESEDISRFFGLMNLLWNILINAIWF